jgi:UDP-glucose 4-epimerase
MKVLVTGGAGFIGSHVVDRLIAAGHEPRIFDLGPSPYPEHRAVDTVTGDLMDPRAVLAAARGCDAIAHLAASADVGIVAEHPLAAEELNARGTMHVLEAARETGARVLYASTIWAYSDVQAELVDEDTDLAPPSHLYTATKVAGEMYCRSYRELYDVKSTILRFGIPYGPRARPAAVLPIFVRKALAGEPLTIAGDGAQTRRFVYVEDLADGVVAALRPAAVDRTYNLVGSEDTSIRQIADAVSTAVGEVEIVHTPGRPGDFAGAQVSGARAAAELGWTATTPFAEGVRHYVAWHRAKEQPAQVAGARPARKAATGIVALRFAALAAVVVATLAGYVLAIEAAGLTDAAAGTAGVVATVAALCTLSSGRVSGWIAWSVGGLVLLPLFVPNIAESIELARLDPTLLVLGAAGAGLALPVITRGRELAQVPEGT